MRKRNWIAGVAALTSCLTLMGCMCPHDDWDEATCTKPRTCVNCLKTEGEPLGHTWVDATCIEPKTCSACGETEGDASGHAWTDATCTKPKTCSVCGETDGNALGHKWTDASCIEPKTCSVCGETEGDALGHAWTDATCTEPKTCSVCGETDDNALGHAWTDASCTEPKTCSVCGETEGDALGHEWTDATYTDPKTCSICGETEGSPLEPEAVTSSRYYSETDYYPFTINGVNFVIGAHCVSYYVNGHIDNSLDEVRATIYKQHANGAYTETNLSDFIAFYMPTNGIHIEDWFFVQGDSISIGFKYEKGTSYYYDSQSDMFI